MRPKNDKNKENKDHSSRQFGSIDSRDAALRGSGYHKSKAGMSRALEMSENLFKPGKEAEFDPFSDHYLFKVTSDFVNFLELLDREKCFRNTTTFKKLFKNVTSYEIYNEVQQVCSKIRLTPSSKFLACYLAKNFITSNMEKGTLRPTDKVIYQVCHSAIFLAAKMRERDIYCPMISHILVAGERELTYEQIREYEIKLCKFFDWNLAMLTFYDYLEQFCALGVITEGDSFIQKLSIEDSSTSSLKLVGNIEQLDSSKKGQLIRNIIRMALHISHYIASNYLTDKTTQRELAYLILVLARKKNFLAAYDHPLLRKLYCVKVQDEPIFKSCLVEINRRCSRNFEGFKISLERFDDGMGDGDEAYYPFTLFDFVEREYDKEGNMVAENMERAEKLIRMEKCRRLRARKKGVAVKMKDSLSLRMKKGLRNDSLLTPNNYTQGGQQIEMAEAEKTLKRLHDSDMLNSSVKKGRGGNDEKKNQFQRKDNKTRSKEAWKKRKEMEARERSEEFSRGNKNAAARPLNEINASSHRTIIPSVKKVKPKMSELSDVFIDPKKTRIAKKRKYQGLKGASKVDSGGAKGGLPGVNLGPEEGVKSHQQIGLGAYGSQKGHLVPRNLPSGSAQNIGRVNENSFTQPIQSLRQSKFNEGSIVGGAHGHQKEPSEAGKDQPTNQKKDFQKKNFEVQMGTSEHKLSALNFEKFKNLSQLSQTQAEIDPKSDPSQINRKQFEADFGSNKTLLKKYRPLSSSIEGVGKDINKDNDTERATANPHQSGRSLAQTGEAGSLAGLKRPYLIPKDLLPDLKRRESDLNPGVAGGNNKRISGSFELQKVPKNSVSYESNYLKSRIHQQGQRRAVPTVPNSKTSFDLKSAETGLKRISEAESGPRKASEPSEQAKKGLSGVESYIVSKKSAQADSDTGDQIPSFSKMNNLKDSFRAQNLQNLGFPTKNIHQSAQNTKRVRNDPENSQKGGSKLKGRSRGSYDSLHKSYKAPKPDGFVINQKSNIHQSRPQNPNPSAQQDQFVRKLMPETGSSLPTTKNAPKQAPQLAINYFPRVTPKQPKQAHNTSTANQESSELLSDRDVIPSSSLVNIKKSERGSNKDLHGKQRIKERATEGAKTDARNSQGFQNYLQSAKLKESGSPRAYNFDLNINPKLASQALQEHAKLLNQANNRKNSQNTTNPASKGHITSPSKMGHKFDLKVSQGEEAPKKHHHQPSSSINLQQFSLNNHQKMVPRKPGIPFEGVTIKQKDPLNSIPGYRSNTKEQKVPPKTLKTQKSDSRIITASGLQNPNKSIEFEKIPYYKVPGHISKEIEARERGKGAQKAQKPQIVSSRRERTNSKQRGDPKKQTGTKSRKTSGLNKLAAATKPGYHHHPHNHHGNHSRHQRTQKNQQLDHSVISVESLTKTSGKAARKSSDHVPQLEINNKYLLSSKNQNFGNKKFEEVKKGPNVAPNAQNGQKMALEANSGKNVHLSGIHKKLNSGKFGGFEGVGGRQRDTANTIQQVQAPKNASLIRGSNHSITSNGKYTGAGDLNLGKMYYKRSATQTGGKVPAPTTDNLNKSGYRRDQSKSKWHSFKNQSKAGAGAEKHSKNIPGASQMRQKRRDVVPSPSNPINLGVTKNQEKGQKVNKKQDLGKQMVQGGLNQPIYGKNNKDSFHAKLGLEKEPGALHFGLNSSNPHKAVKNAAGGNHVVNSNRNQRRSRQIQLVSNSATASQQQNRWKPVIPVEAKYQPRGNQGPLRSPPQPPAGTIQAKNSKNMVPGPGSRRVIKNSVKLSERTVNVSSQQNSKNPSLVVQNPHNMSQLSSDFQQFFSNQNKGARKRGATAFPLKTGSESVYNHGSLKTSGINNISATASNTKNSFIGQKQSHAKTSKSTRKSSEVNKMALRGSKFSIYTANLSDLRGSKMTNILDSYSKPKQYESVRLQEHHHGHHNHHKLPGDAYLKNQLNRPDKGKESLPADKGAPKMHKDGPPKAYKQPITSKMAAGSKSVTNKNFTQKFGQNFFPSPQAGNTGMAINYHTQGVPKAPRPHQANFKPGNELKSYQMPVAPNKGFHQIKKKMKKYRDQTLTQNILNSSTTGAGGHNTHTNHQSANPGNKPKKMTERELLASFKQQTDTVRPTPINMRPYPPTEVEKATQGPHKPKNAYKADYSSQPKPKFKHHFSHQNTVNCSSIADTPMVSKLSPDLQIAAELGKARMVKTNDRKAKILGNQVFDNFWTKRKNDQILQTAGSNRKGFSSNRSNLLKQLDMPHHQQQQQQIQARKGQGQRFKVSSEILGLPHRKASSSQPKNR